MNPIARRSVLMIVAAGLLGLGVFSVMVYRAVDIEVAGAEDAARRFTAVRATLPPGKPVLTLVTCKDYDEKSNSYLKRVVVRAVLVSVD